MSKLRTVIRHEYLTIVRQPAFWIMMLAIPLIIVIVLGLSYLGNKSSEERINDLAKDLKNVTIVDESGLINKDVAKSAGLSLSPATEKDSYREAVRTEKREALVIFPKDLAKSRTYQVYLSSNDLTKSSTVSSLANNLLKTSLFLPLGSADIIALAQNGAESKLTTYRDGAETAGFNEYVVPGTFVVLFYIVFAFSVGYMLTSVSEEKENRSMEMVLTYIKPRDLILGKLLGVSLVTITQVTFFTLLGLAAYFLARNTEIGQSLGLPAGIDLSQLVFNPLAIFFGLGFLIVGFLMFAGFMTATAAAAPSSKEANNFSAVFYIGAFIPFYFVMMILTDPENPITKFITFFPLTSPVVTLLRNTVGNMSVLEASLALAVMTGFMMLSIAIAVRAFRLGALEFSQRIQLSKLFKK
ncbi:MAG TPA: ABC transporter permease [Candidatus Saccharimonadales bacterium]